MYKTRKTIARGDFNVISIGHRHKSVDIQKAKKIIKQNRQNKEKILSGKGIAQKEEKRIKEWWKKRRHWKTFIHEGFIGKIDPVYSKIEFVDGSYGYIRDKFVMVKDNRKHKP